MYGRHSLLSPTLLYAPAVIRRREILPIKARVPCYSSWAVKPNCPHSGVLLKPTGLSITIGKYTVRRLLPCVWFLLAELCLAFEPPWSNNDHFITQGTCSIGSCPLACGWIWYCIRTVRVSATRYIFHWCINRRTATLSRDCEDNAVRRVRRQYQGVLEWL